jgi:hypothetical protein
MSNLATAQRLKEEIEQLKQRLYRAKANLSVHKQALKDKRLESKVEAEEELKKLKIKKANLEELIIEKTKEWNNKYESSFE